MLIGSKPISRAATASIGDLIGPGQEDVFPDGLHDPRPRAVPGRRPVHDAEQSRVDFLLDGQQVDQRFMDAGMRPVALMVQQPSERVFHRPGRHRVDMAFDRRQMDDIPADEKIRNPQVVAVDIAQGPHPGAGLERHPGHVLVLEIEQDLDPVGFEDGLVAVQILALEGVGDFGLILDADQVGEAVPPQGQDRPFELPGRGVGRGKGEMPADVVLEDGRRPGFQTVRPVRQLKQPDVSSRTVSGVVRRIATLALLTSVSWSVTRRKTARRSVFDYNTDGGIPRPSQGLPPFSLGKIRLILDPWRRKRIPNSGFSVSKGREESRQPADLRRALREPASGIPVPVFLYNRFFDSRGNSIRKTFMRKILQDSSRPEFFLLGFLGAVDGRRPRRTSDWRPKFRIELGGGWLSTTFGDLGLIADADDAAQTFLQDERYTAMFQQQKDPLLDVRPAKDEGIPAFQKRPALGRPSEIPAAVGPGDLFRGLPDVLLQSREQKSRLTFERTVSDTRQLYRKPLLRSLSAVVQLLRRPLHPLLQHDRGSGRRRVVCSSPSGRTISTRFTRKTGRRDSRRSLEGVRPPSAPSVNHSLRMEGKGWGILVEGGIRFDFNLGSLFVDLRRSRLLRPKRLCDQRQGPRSDRFGRGKLGREMDGPDGYPDGGLGLRDHRFQSTTGRKRRRR